MREFQASYGEQILRLSAMCENEGLAEEVVHVIMRFHVEPPPGTTPVAGWRRRKTLYLKDRAEAAAEALGLTYTLFQDPESSYRNPEFVMVVTTKMWLLLEFYRALAED